MAPPFFFVLFVPAMRDPYLVLGVSKSATADEIKSTYRKLAKKLHPDVNQGRKDIEQKFKEVTAAYDFLSDADRRAKYDRGEIGADGSPRGYGGGNPFGGGSSSAGRGRTRGAGGDPFSHFSGMEDIFSEFMGGQGSRAGAGAAADVTYALTIPFSDACLGGKRRVTLANGKTIDVTIPAGVTDGHKLRLRGQGETVGRTVGDAIIEINIEPHAQFTRKENDIYQTVAISLPEAVLGASIEVATLAGAVMLKVPAGANTGTTLRLKGKGVPASKTDSGDMYVELKIMLPEKIPQDLVEFFEKWNKKHAYNPRKK